MKRVTILAGVMLTGVLSLAIANMRAQQPKMAEIQKVKDNLYMIKGGGGNTAAFVTSSGVVVVDTKDPGWGQAILDKIKTVTDKPVTMIINTHTHGDHTGSNADFPTSVEIVAQENCKVSMEKMPAFEGDQAKFLPKKTYKERLSLLGGTDKIDLYYFGAGHTNGDTIVVFPALGVAHAGDLFAGKNTPLIDVNNGGSGVAYPQTLAKAAAGIKGVDTVITGHSEVSDWKSFQDYGEFNKAFLTAVQQAITAGKTIDDAVATLTLPEKFKDYGMRGAKDNVTKIYAELKK